MADLQARVLQEISRHHLITDHDRILIGVSGGGDSVALLLLLHELFTPVRLAAAYIDHQLRPIEVEQEKDLVAALCEQLQVPFYAAKIDVYQERSLSGESTEACARRLRYAAMEDIRISCNADLIAVGHTGDDQAEELCIRLIRGSGRKGLSGMSWKNGRIIRPLLSTAKAELTAYLEHRGITPCLDSSNLSRRFLRNRVRLDLLPLLNRDFQPAITDILRNTADVLTAEEDYLEAETTRILPSLIRTTSTSAEEGAHKHHLTLSIAPFLSIHQALQRRVIEKLCWRSGCRPNFINIEAIIRCAENGKPGAVLTLPGGVIVRHSGQLLYFTTTGETGRPQLHRQFTESLIINGEGSWQIDAIGARLELTIESSWSQSHHCELAIDADRIFFPLVLRAPMAGERFTPHRGPGSKKVSRFLADRKIPRHLRYRYPVLVSGAAIVAIPGMTVAETCAITELTRRFLVVRWICFRDQP